MTAKRTTGYELMQKFSGEANFKKTKAAAEWHLTVNLDQMLPLQICTILDESVNEIIIVCSSSHKTWTDPNDTIISVSCCCCCFCSSTTHPNSDIFSSQQIPGLEINHLSPAVYAVIAKYVSISVCLCVNVCFHLVMFPQNTPCVPGLLGRIFLLEITSSHQYVPLHRTRSNCAEYPIMADDYINSQFRHVPISAFACFYFCLALYPRGPTRR